MLPWRPLPATHLIENKFSGAWEVTRRLRNKKIHKPMSSNRKSIRLITSCARLKGANRTSMSSPDSMQNCHWRKENYSSRDWPGRVIYEKSQLFRLIFTHSLRLSCHSTCPLPQRILLSKRTSRLYESRLITFGWSFLRKRSDLHLLKAQNCLEFTVFCNV